MNYIIVGRDGRPSMKGVYREMNGDCILMVRRCINNKVYWREYRNHDINTFRKVKTFNPQRNDKIIRWGSRINFDQTGFKSVNSPEALARATNKKQARLIMEENNISSPRLITPENYDSINPSKIIARPEKHSKGKNFVVLNNKAEFLKHYKPNWYYAEFIKKTSEYRVHCFYGKALCVLQKPKPEDENLLAWNRSLNGEAFNHVPYGEVKRSVVLVALQAVRALGLKMGAVDVIWKNPNAYVLEINTAPTLNSSPLTTTKYARAFDWALRFGNREWDFTKFTKGSSLLWKDHQFNQEIENDNQ